MCYKRGLLKGDAYYFHLEEQTELFSLDSFFQMSFQYLYIFPILPAIIHAVARSPEQELMLCLPIGDSGQP